MKVDETSSNNNRSSAMKESTTRDDEDEQRLIGIRNAMNNLKTKESVRICPFCLQQISVPMMTHTEKLQDDDHLQDELSEHVSICLNLWIIERRKLFDEKTNIENIHSNEIVAESTNKRKLECCWSNEEERKSVMNHHETATKKKKQSSNFMIENSPMVDAEHNNENCITRLDHVLGDDMLFQILTFLDQSFLIHTCMRVSKYWYERVLFIPMTLSLYDHHSTTLSTLKMITSHPNTFNFTELSICNKDTEKAREIIQLITRNNKFNNIKSLTLEDFGLEKQDISELASGCFKSLTTLYLHDESKTLDSDCCDVIANCVHMKELRELSLSTNHGDDIIQSLCNSEYIKNLTYLDLNNCNVSKKGVTILAKCASMSTLTNLNLGNNGIGEEGVSAIANSSILRNLSILTLNECQLTTNEARSLSKSPYLKNITTLDLCENAITDDGILELCESDLLRNVTNLNLSLNGIGDRGISFMTSKMSIMNNLTILQLDNNSITSIGAKLIAESNTMQHLKELSLINCEIGDEGMIAICQSNFMKNLTKLFVDGNAISERGISSLISSPFCCTLQDLSLTTNDIRDEGARLLSTASFPNLITLQISSCEIGNDGLCFIANNSSFSQLTDLDVGFNKISSEGIQAMCNSPHLKNLTDLSLADNTLCFDDVMLIGRTFENLKYLSTSGLSTEKLEAMLSKLLPKCELHNWEF
ncbi:hypothetical protein C9374_013186 [Naegleria lovaniensis]|uniref:Uncharacterized protein n=1 Tax=Naegleria lovaniensis TaxID=51637 RepID=A0AA88GDS2_NAELO|nr:uncharacterized protein C9374_013186 [Naegleria lovaniensis]KAG2372734.1 hypothetical protein C9374_013186 [Naegleria lovaniensis]